MSRKFLNIGNSSRIFNINLMTRESIAKKIKIHRLNEDKIEKEMDLLAKKSKRFPIKDQNEYIIFQEKYTNDKLIRKVIQHGGTVSYYTDSTVPYYVLKQLATHTDSEVIFQIREEFTDAQVENVNLSFMATQVIIDCPVVVPDNSPYDILFSLHDLKTDVDKVQLSFPPLREIAERHEKYYEQRDDELYHLKPMYQYQYYGHIERSLSLWAMNIFIVANTDYDHKELKKYVDKARSKRSPGSKKKKVGAKDE